MARVMLAMCGGERGVAHNQTGTTWALATEERGAAAHYDEARLDQAALP
jgi:hypothetical protein